MRPALRGALAALLALSCAACGGEKAKHWNVLLITLDTVRADYFGSYGRPGDPTPHLDALAASGILFERAFSTSAVTPVSHASILTGLEPPRHGLRVLSADGGYRLPEAVPSLARLLRAHGFTTGAVHSAFPVSAHFGLDQGFEHFDSFDADMRVEGESHSWDVESLQRRSDETSDRAIRYVEGLAGDAPFFLWVHYWDPHDPVLLPPPDRMRGLAGLNPAHPRVYAREISYVDEQIGRLLAALEQRGALAKTLVAVTADHGQGLGDHGWYGHRILYQEQIHVPLILRVPGGPRGVRSRAPVGTIDIAPTILDWLGIEAPEMDGISLRGIATGGDPPARTLYADQVNAYDRNAKIVQVRPQADLLYAVTDGRWKLIYRPTRPEQSELYDLSTDPHEANNLYASRREERERLLASLAGRDPWVLAPFSGSGEGPGPEVSRALEALGYLQGEGTDATAPTRWEWWCPSSDARSADREAPGCPEGWIPRSDPTPGEGG